MIRLRFATARQVRLRCATAGQALRLASTSALRATADKSLARGRVRLVFLVAAFAVMGGSSPVFACPMCFGAEETSMIGATKLGILVMLGITLAVQGAFVGFFLYLRRHAKRAADIELDSEWSELQRASKT